MIKKENLIVDECIGCCKIATEWKSGKRFCAYHKFPNIQWQYGFKCKNASHIGNKEDEDPTDWGRYDSRGR